MDETTKIEQFWQWVTTARKFTFNLLFLLIILIILISILGSIFSGSKLPDPEGKALVFNPQGPIVEQVSGLGVDPPVPGRVVPVTVVSIVLPGL